MDTKNIIIAILVLFIAYLLYNKKDTVAVFSPVRRHEDFEINQKENFS